MKKKLALLLTFTIITTSLVACGGDTQADNDIIAQIEKLNIAIDGFVIESGYADGKDVTFEGNLTDYTILSENADLITVEGIVANKGLITKEPVLIDFSINESGKITSWIINTTLPEIEPTLPLTADLILDMELIGEKNHPDSDAVNMREVIPINKETITSIRFAEPEDYDFHDHDDISDNTLCYYGDIILELTDGRQFYAFVRLDYYHDYDDNYEKSNDEPKWTNIDSKIDLRNLRKENN